MDELVWFIAIPVGIAVVLISGLIISDWSDQLQTIISGYIGQTSSIKKVSFDDFRKMYAVNPKKIEVMWKGDKWINRVAVYSLPKGSYMYLYFNFIDSLRYSRYINSGRMERDRILSNQDEVSEVFYKSLQDDLNLIRERRK